MFFILRLGLESAPGRYSFHYSCDMKLSANIVHSCEIWIWMDVYVAKLVNQQISIAKLKIKFLNNTNKVFLAFVQNLLMRFFRNTTLHE